ncbi:MULTISPECIES: CerR family C-terminal domain-containing protein [Pacificimonas]|uniref:CerR family C-terminal domain-containing protein n=1 Tax=Pacificimonas aurantium TaxID=1250540 RepID=A0ABS7WIY3_9SPHN|nr:MULTISPECIES: CerR family C-terminal domain-containing protein [Pacificimonas]MBZ6378357.1 CerR family C-terminal domain-containing protein [Pacificimonas aurantium]
MSTTDHSDIAATAASARGEETRDRILRAALTIFGKDGFERATTRKIAEAAEVNLPAIKYYFESKEGLYLACARSIVGVYERGVGETVVSIAQQAVDGLSPEAARASLKTVVRLLVELIEASPGANLWTGFVLREMTVPGPAFEILYNELWAPGVELTAMLIAQIEGRPVADEDARLTALLLHGGMTAFSTTWPVSRKYLGWTENPKRLTETMLPILEAQIDRLGR